ncbi:MAG TPA: hypothetical protein PLK67_11785, partial [Bryobacteraceae bacterium]|nr:hypothetical protein [Bryobacteraceae bacterium]
MIRSFYISLALAALLPGLAADPAPRLVEVERIVGMAPHNAFTDLVRFKGRWYCSLREGKAHVSPD